MLLQSVAGTYSAQVIVVTAIQTVSSPGRAVSLPSRAVAFVPTRSGRNRSRNHKRSSPVKWLRSGQWFLLTRMEIVLLRGLAAAPV